MILLCMKLEIVLSKLTYFLAPGSPISGPVIKSLHTTIFITAMCTKRRIRRMEYASRLITNQIHSTTACGGWWVERQRSHLRGMPCTQILSHSVKENWVNPIPAGFLYQNSGPMVRHNAYSWILAYALKIK